MLNKKLKKIFLVLVAVLFLIFIFQNKNNGAEKKLFNLEKIEITRTSAEQARGLSGRASLPENAGMLFSYSTNARPAFWMKEMNFAIDIIWLDENWRVVGWEKNISPDTYPQTFSPNQAIRYVLEVNAGFVDKHQIKLGEKAYN